MFVPCGGLHVSFLLHVKYTISYRNGLVSYSYHALMYSNSKRDSLHQTEQET